MKQSSEELALAQMVECDYDDKVDGWFSHSVKEMGRRSAMTPLEIWEVVKGGGHHFFASIDEMIVDCGSYRRPRNCDELSLCLFEYSSKLEQLGLDPALRGDSHRANTVASFVETEDEALETDDDFWVGACNEMFHAMSRVLRGASSRAARQTRRASAGDAVVSQMAPACQRVDVAPLDNVNAELHETVRAHFALMIANGKRPRVLVGGESDGLAYFPTNLAGDEYCLTEAGLLTSPLGTPQPIRWNE